LAALRGIGRRPTLWVELGVGAAWIALTLGALAGQSASGEGPGWASGPLWICMTGMAGTGGGGTSHAAASSALAPGDLVAGLPMWALMSVAMMVPPALPAVVHVAGRSLYWRRRRATLEFLAIFLAIWVAYGALVLAPLRSWGATASGYALAAALALAALWQLTPLKRRAMRACHRSRPLPPRGWRASAGVASFALRNGGACLASCWALMLAAAIAGPATLAWMAAATAAIVAERLQPRPRRTSRRVAALLAAAALGVAGAAVVG
jgi:predicted metal-binding membrane protein